MAVWAPSTVTMTSAGTGSETRMRSSTASVGAQYANRCVDSIELDTQLMRYAAMTKQERSLFAHPVRRRVKNTGLLLESAAASKDFE